MSLFYKMLLSYVLVFPWGVISTLLFGLGYGIFEVATTVISCGILWIVVLATLGRFINRE